MRQTVESICRIQADMHEIRVNLVAYGVPFQTVNVLVEMGARDKLSEQEDLIEAALAGSASELGVGALSRDTLMQQLGLLINLENDTAEVRRLAKSQGLELPALNALTLFVRQNPGDGGARMIRCFVAYALACGRIARRDWFPARRADIPQGVRAAGDRAPPGSVRARVGNAAGPRGTGRSPDRRWCDVARGLIRQPSSCRRPLTRRVRS